MTSSQGTVVARAHLCLPYKRCAFKEEKARVRKKSENTRNAYAVVFVTVLPLFYMCCSGRM